MFTGIIEGLGTVNGIQSDGRGKKLSIEADFSLEQTGLGDSICVSGACLTVVKISGSRFDVDVSPETLAKTTFDRVRIGERVNLERALRLSDRLDGHLVSGHIDGTGVIKRRQTVGNAVVVAFEAIPPLTRYMISKGSVAVDGISLTINSCDATGFEVSIIPHTSKMTTLGFKGRGAAVNIETDMIAKYVERFAIRQPGRNQNGAAGNATVGRELLARSGFL